MPQFMEPNSDAWLAALDAHDPTEAMRIRAVLALALDRSVCSLCGSLPAGDYWVIARTNDPSPVPTFRLCLHCREAREAIYAQKLVPV
jgi:hypothetical protein